MVVFCGEIVQYDSFCRNLYIFCIGPFYRIYKNVSYIRDRLIRGRWELMLNKIPFLKKKETIDIEDVKELIEQTENEVESEIASAVETEEQHDEPEQKKGLFHIPDKAKSNKEIRELILAVEQVAYQYQSSEHKIQELDNRVIFTTSQVTEQQAENRRLQLALENRDRITEELEEKMMDKNLQFEQVMEELKETKSQLRDEIEELKSIVNIEQNIRDAQLEKTGQEKLRC